MTFTHYYLRIPHITGLLSLAVALPIGCSSGDNTGTGGESDIGSSTPGTVNVLITRVPRHR